MSQTNNEKYHIRKDYEAFDLISDLAWCKQDDLPPTQLAAVLFALKYIIRAGRKNGTDDLLKAENLIHRARTGEWLK